MLDFLLNLEQWLPVLLENYGVWIYAILFLVIFAETGSVFMFFLPGDSLLIAIGALCSTTDVIHLHYMGITLITASILGYTVNYYTGSFLGIKYFNKHTRYFKPEYMVKTNNYFLKHGGKTILVARFVPFVRSFAPFAAGSAKMNLASFTFYNVIGGFIWIGLLLAIGYGVGHTLYAVADVF
ncbi:MULTISPECIES: VTT domain-containing protein [unclassified Acinetobacter]|uniref:VTT domain-containing protein n=1 Tax=unclassified Acinetobacter TaxID=196816 RepID=UPI002934BC0F|nr:MULTISPECIES: VTT domain-containing protein [unclassified Acinetobacter]WOE30680.1 VTT domain-containing protein [Acinetobacter sp. SAAs470]WOE38873.1 VTT domain-containing protein [Acinetobacter sp. SAAs474]